MSEGRAEASRLYDDPVGVMLMSEEELTRCLGTIRAAAEVHLRSLLQGSDVLSEIRDGLWDAEVITAVVLRSVIDVAQARENSL